LEVKWNWAQGFTEFYQPALAPNKKNIPTTALRFITYENSA